jgi:hypothetical protein
MVNEDAALLNRRVTHMTPAALFSRRLQQFSWRFANILHSVVQKETGIKELSGDAS